MNSRPTSPSAPATSWEVARTLRAREAFLGEDFETLGALMTETHRSFQSLYECSCEELDVLVGQPSPRTVSTGRASRARGSAAAS